MKNLVIKYMNKLNRALMEHAFDTVDNNYDDIVKDNIRVELLNAIFWDLCREAGIVFLTQTVRAECSSGVFEYTEFYLV